MQTTEQRIESNSPIRIAYENGMRAIEAIERALEDYRAKGEAIAIKMAQFEKMIERPTPGTITWL
jgi:hypothetical protein